MRQQVILFLFSEILKIVCILYRLGRINRSAGIAAIDIG